MLEYQQVTYYLKSRKDDGELVHKDREMLGNNGLVLVSTTVNKKSKEIINGPEVLTRGFMYAKENQDVIEEIKNKTKEIIKDNIHGKFADYVKIRSDVREEVGNYLYKLTESRPVILTLIQEL